MKDDLIRTGFSDLDKMISGFRKGQLVIVSGTNEAGKTAFVANVAAYLALTRKVKIGIAIHGLSKEEFIQNMLCLASGVSESAVKNGTLKKDEWPRVTQAAANLSEAPLYFYELSSTAISEIEQGALKLKRDYGIQLLIIDSEGFERDESTLKNDEAEKYDVSQKFKNLAMKLDIPLVLLCPCRMDNARDRSNLGCIGKQELNADLVLMFYHDQDESNSLSAEMKTEVIVAKNRWGAVGKVWLNFK